MVLYRKYRPASFREFLGNPIVIEVLKNSVVNSAISSGYLFAGPRGTGKTSLARILAKAINCSSFSKMGDVCNNCNQCESISAFRNPDVLEIDAASNRSVDDVRALRESLDFLPTFSKYKVYIIDEAHMLTNVAFNALLKVLEEPPGHVVFILLTTEVHKIPITILSRLQRFDLSLQDKDTLISKLKYIAESEKVSYPEYLYEVIFRLSGGSFRDAESLFSTVVSSKHSFLNESDVDSFFGLNSKEYFNNLVNLSKKLVYSGSEELQEENLKALMELINKACTNVADPGYLVDQVLNVFNDQLKESSLDLKDYVLLSDVFLRFKKQLKLLTTRVNYSNLFAVCFVEASRNYRTVTNISTEPVSISNTSMNQRDVDNKNINANSNNYGISNNVTQILESDAHIKITTTRLQVVTNEVKLGVDQSDSDVDKIQNSYPIPTLLMSILSRSEVKIIDNTCQIGVKSKSDLVELSKHRNIENIKRYYGVGEVFLNLFDSYLDETSSSGDNNLGGVDLLVGNLVSNMNKTEKNNSSLVENIL